MLFNCSNNESVNTLYIVPKILKLFKVKSTMSQFFFFIILLRPITEQRKTSISVEKQE